MTNQKGKVSGTLVFSIFVIALVVYVFFFVYKKGQHEDEKKQLDTKVYSGLELPSVKQLTIVPNPNDPIFDIKVEKNSDQWRILSPVNDVADKDAVETFIRSLLDEKTQDSVSDQAAGDLKTYGLDHPKGELTLKKNSGDDISVSVGSVKAYDGNVYAKISTKPGIYLLSSVWDSYIDKKANDFRSKKIERAQFHEWDHVVSTVAGQPRVELKKVDGHWESIPKSEIPLQDNLVEGYVFQLVNLEILDFVAETKTDLAKYSLAQPQIEVKLSGEKDKKPHDFNLLLSKYSPDKKPEHASATSSELSGVVEVYSAILNVASRGAKDFYNRKYPFQYDPTQASRIRIQTSNVKLLAEKRNNKWEEVEASSKVPLSSEAVDELTKAISRLETSNYLSEKGKGLKPAKNTIEIFDSKNNLLMKVSWGDEYKPKESDPANAGIKFFYAETSKVPNFVLTLKQSAVDDLQLKSLFQASTPTPSPSPSSANKSSKEAHP